MTQGPLWDLPLVSAFKMKKTLKALLGLVAIITLFSCVQEKVGEEMKISGQFALINESGLTDCFLEFQNGVFSIWKSTDSYPFAEKRIWHCNSSCFVNYTRAAYSIINGVITIGGTSLGKIELADDVLHFDGKTYGAMEGFYSETYSWIIGDSDKISLTYAAESVRFPVHVEHPIPAGVLHATTSASWIGDLRIEDDCLLFNTTTTNEDRSTTITLSYLHANDLSIPVSQTPSTFIHFTEPNKTIGYEASSHNLEFTIENPIASSALAVTCANSWIENLEVKDDMISFNVTENNSGNDRKAFFYCKYEGAPNVMYTLTQKWTAPAISFSPASAEFDYTGGQGSFTVEVQNPRQDVTIVPQCQANWIKDITVNGNTVSYKVTENNSTTQRNSSILVGYGNFDSASFSVIQAGKPVISLSLNKTKLSLHPGDDEYLTATVDPADAIPTWSSDNESVATVSQSGKVTAVGNGTATIRVSADNGKNASCYVTVTTLVTRISFEKTSISLFEGEELTLTPTVSPENASNKELKWTATDKSIAAVDQNGKVTAVSKGTTSIRAEAQDGSGKYATCSITVKRPISNIQLNKTSLILYRGKSNVMETLVATVNPTDASNTEISWSSSNTALATVSSSGVITAIAPGNVTITATAKDGSGVSARCEVEIRQYVTDITLDKNALSLRAGDSYTITATVSPINASNKTLIWSSSNSKVITVDANGLVSAIAIGDATITVAANDGGGEQAICSVVVAEEIVDLGLSVKWRGWNLGASKPEEYGDYYAWGETEPYYSQGHSQDNPCGDWRSRTNPAITGYNWSSYKWCNGSQKTLTRYNSSSSYGTVDNKTSFKDYDYEDDAARAILGGKWRTPTRAEWDELLNNCTWVWTSNYMGTGVKGHILTSKVNGYKDKSIFLPAAGYRRSADLNYAGFNGIYWSSSLNSSGPSNAWSVSLMSNNVSSSNDAGRCYGRSVRPVSE